MNKYNHMNVNLLFDEMIEDISYAKKVNFYKNIKK